MRLLLLLMIIPLINLTVYAQSNWQYTYGNNINQFGNAVCQTADSGFIMAGATFNPVSGQDMLIIKTTALGDTVWTRVIAGSGSDRAYSCQQTYDGGYIISGSTISFGFGNYDVFLIKLDAYGNLQWSKCVGNAGAEVSHSCQQTSDSGFVVAGYIFNAGASQGEFYMAKIRANGTLHWTRSYGGLGHEAANFVQQTFDNGYIIGGTTISWGAGDYDALLIKTDAYGNPAWSKTYGGLYKDEISCVRQTADSGYILTGFSEGAANSGKRAILVKTNDLGDTVWTRAYHDNFTECTGTSVLETPDHNFVFTGDYGAPTKLLLVRTDINGDTLWTKKYGGIYYDAALCVAPTIDNGFIIAGKYNVPVPAPSVSECYLVKTDSAGNSDCLQYNWPVYVSYPNLQVLVPPLSAYAPNHQIMAVTPQVNSGCNVTNLCVPVGDDENYLAIPFQIYPNPSSGTFKLTFADEINFGFVELFTLSGQSICKEMLRQSRETTLQLNLLKNGIYIAKVFDGSDCFFQKICIVQE